jgi:hypothetical protein
MPIEDEPPSATASTSGYDAKRCAKRRATSRRRGSIIRSSFGHYEPDAWPLFFCKRHLSVTRSGVQGSREPSSTQATRSMPRRSASTK